MFPLSALLHALESDGFRLTVRDYDRMARALGCNEKWTLARLRDVLLALLAKDENQREILGQRFDIFFDVKVAVSDMAAVDITKIRAELQNFRPNYDISHVKRQRRAAPIPQPPVPTPQDPRRWQRRLLFLTLAGLVVGLILAWILIPVAPILHVSPPAHVLTTTPQTPETTEFTIRNTGGGRLVIKQIELISKTSAFEIVPNNCEGSILEKDGKCLVPIEFTPKAQGRHDAELSIISDANDFSADLTGHCNQVEETQPGVQGEIEKLTPQIVMPQGIVIQGHQKTVIAGSETWWQIAVLAGFFLFLTLIFSWYLIQARQPPKDQAPVWDDTKPRHFPLEKVGGESAPRLDNEILAHLADSMGYFRSERAGRRPDIDASVLATVEQGGMPRLVFHRRKELRHLIILENGLAGEALALNPIAGELRAGMIRHGVALVYGRFFGDPAVFYTESGQALYLEDLEAARRSFLLLIFSDGSSRDMVHTLENLMRWPQVAWFDLRASEIRDAAAALPAKYGIPLYSATAAGLLKAFARFLSEMAPQMDAAEDAAGWKGPPPQGETPLSAYLETRLGDALPWAQACSMVQPIGSGLADGLRRTFYRHLPTERIERLAALPGTNRNAAGFCFSTAVLAELRQGFAQRHPTTSSPAAGSSGPEKPLSGLPSQEDVLNFILAELQKSWTRAVQEKPELQGSPAQLAWERQYRRVQLELEPDAALQRLAELAASPLGNAVKADLEKVRLPGDVPKGKILAGIPLRKSPVKKDSLQRLARIAKKSGIPALHAYPLKWWQKGLAALLALGFLGTAGWSGWAYLQTADLRPRIEVAGGPDMRVKAAVERMEKGDWQQVYQKTGLPFQVEVTPGSRYRLALYDFDEETPFDHKNLDVVEKNQDVQLVAEPEEKSQTLGYLVATNFQRQVLQNHWVTVRNARFSQAVAANKTLHLAPGKWRIKVEMGDDPAREADTPVGVGGSDWKTVTIETGKKNYAEFTTDVYFRDQLKSGGYGPQLVSIPDGSFTMGSPDGEEGRDSDEGPQHMVSLDAFAIGRYEVTFVEYDAFCEATGREKPNDEGWGRGSRPVINVSWEDARDYAVWLSGQTGTEYRLPTEAEWEYAARAGTETSFYWGNEVDEACRYGNVHDETSKVLNKFDWNHHPCYDEFGQTAPAGLYAANDFALYDMAGNVWEWVSDWYAEDYYANSPGDNPPGPEKGVDRVVRGGSWDDDPSGVRSAGRDGGNPAGRDVGVGFRLARTDPRPSYPSVEEKGRPEYPQVGRLFVQANQENATVRILNIKPKFFQGMELEPGRYHVEVAAEGYETEKRWVDLIDPGEDKRIHFKLEKIALQVGRLFAKANPENATVRILNIGPKFFQGMELEPGSYHIEVAAEGYETERRWIDIVAGHEDPFRFELSKLLDSIKFGRYYALIIGNINYRKLPKLKTAVNDARKVAEILGDKYGFDTKLLLNASREDIIRALDKFRTTLTENDNLLIYYAGHGFFDTKNNRGYWQPVDADPDSIANWIPNEAINDMLNIMSAKSVLIIADSVYSGSLPRGVVAQLESAKSDEVRIRWIEELSKGRSRMVFTSGEYMPVLDAGGGGHSVFAKVLLDVLESNDEIIEGDRLHQQINALVVYESEKYGLTQIPQYAANTQAGHESGDFIFVPKK